MLNNLEIIRFILTDFETNSYLIRRFDSQFGVLIDPGAEAKKIKKKLKDKKLQLEAILLTHGHGDHISGIPFFSAPVYIHSEDAKFLKDPHLNLSQIFFTPLVIDIKPETFRDGQVLEFPLSKLTFKVIHTPGHTPGSSCFLIEDILFSGDTLFKQGVGRTDFPLSSWEQLKNSLKSKIYQLPDNIHIYPGHGEETTILYEKKHNPFVYE